MRALDFAPLYRSTVGFDRLFSMLDNLSEPQSAPAYPPYNIERTGENAYRISMAVAGFGEDDLSIESRENTLTIKGERTEQPDEDGKEILFRGIAARSFERRFQLADHVEVRSANLENGLLHIDLVRNIPEAMKPRKIEIAKAEGKTAGGPKQIEGKADTKVKAKTEAGETVKA
ncbi:MAG: Hsp20 family protein [Nitratireductor sp.]